MLVFDLWTLVFEFAFVQQRSKAKGQRQKAQDPHLSISPKTISNEPMIATTSATISPFAKSGKADRFTKLGPRKCTRLGFGPPSDRMYTPNFAFRSLDRMIDLTSRHVKSFGNDQEMMDQSIHVFFHCF